jgi:hypothetical protein
MLPQAGFEPLVVPWAIVFLGLAIDDGRSYKDATNTPHYTLLYVV